MISMIAYHLSWDLVYLFDADMPWMLTKAAYIWQQSICWSFILISGFCWPMGHNHLKNGIKLCLLGGVISLVTSLFLPEGRILFGVLTFLGSAALLLILPEPILKKVHPVLGLVLSFSVFLALRGISSHYLGFSHLNLPLPDGIYRNYFTTWLGFPFRGFWSADYFGVLPWFFLYLSGFFLHGIYERYRPERGHTVWKERILSLLGRHSLLVYLAHQPVIYGLLVLILRIIH